MRSIRWTFLSLALLALVPAAAHAVTVPADFDDRRVASLPVPTALAPLPDGRLLIGTQGGVVRTFEDGSLRPAVALNISATTCFRHEGGLLGVTADPNFATNHFIYVFAGRVLPDGSCVNRVSRFVLDGDVADPASEVVLLTMYVHDSGAHSGGDLHFGKDGFLYVTSGDGYCPYDNPGCPGTNDAARRSHTLLGKILRIRRDGSIPPGNPHALTGNRCNVTGQTTVGAQCAETFATGLRSPYRFAFDPNATGTRFFVNDVGQADWEEINEGVAGADYGWNVREGKCLRVRPADCPPPEAGERDPVFAYSHDSSCSSVTGGAFVPADAWPAPYRGAYLYSDYVCGTIFRLTQGAGGTYSSQPFATDLGDSSATAMTFARHGTGQALYYASYANGGEIRRISYTGVSNRAPTARVTANPASGAAPLTVTLSGSGSSDPDPGDSLTYVWDFGDGSPATETSDASVTHTYDSSSPVKPPRSYTVTLVVRDEHEGVSDPAKVRVNVGNTPPVPTIVTPEPDSRFRVGQQITLEGRATDAEDGALLDTRLTWEVIRVHNTHTHPFLSPRSGVNGGNDVTFTAPGPEDLASAGTSRLELRLTATDSMGGSTTVTQALNPNIVSVDLRSTPPGLRLSVEELEMTAPRTFASWEGYRIPVAAYDQADGSGREFVFDSWSDGGAAAHTFVTPAPSSPAAERTLTATFREQSSLYRAAVLSTPGLLGYWRLSDPPGSIAAAAFGTDGTYSPDGVTFGAPGALLGDGDPGAAFNGVNGEVTLGGAGLSLARNGTLEGWFRWEAGRAIMRDGTNNGGWVLAFGDDGVVKYSLAGHTRATDVATASVQSGWHHFVLTKAGAIGSLYIDGELAHTEGGHNNSRSLLPWHVMRNGANAGFTRGGADEIAIYTTALSADTVAHHYIVGSTSSADPPPAAPSALSATARDGSVALNWADNAEADLAGYEVFRATSAGGAYSKLNAGLVSGSSYSDSTVANGRKYFYVVRAVDDAAQHSGYSGEVSATPAGRGGAGGNGNDPLPKAPAVKIRLGSRTLLTRGVLTVVTSCDVACRVSAYAQLARTGSARRAARTRTSTVTLGTPNKPARIRLRLSRKGKRQLLAALRRKGKAALAVSLTATTTPAGPSKKIVRRVRVKRP